MATGSRILRGVSVSGRHVPLEECRTIGVFTAYPAPVQEMRVSRAEMLAELEDQACQRGHQAGLLEGRAQVEPELDDLRATLEIVVRDVWAHRERMVAELEPDVVRLALEVARRVVGEITTRDAERVEHQVAEALRRVTARDRVVVRVHPEDLERVSAHRDRWLRLLEGVEHLEVIEDRRVPRGGCLVTTLEGSVDARWTTQLVEIERALTGEGTRDDRDA